MSNPPTLGFPLSTGQGASLLDLTEPQLAETVRRGLVHPPPPVRAGRRLWGRDHLLQAAEALGLLTEDLRAKLGEEATQGEVSSRGAHQETQNER